MNENKKSKTIAIIGAGMAGIRTAKSAKDAGFAPTVFDRLEHIGGVWAPTGLAWESMHTNIGTYSMTFTDFPWPEGELQFANSRKVHKYLQDYIEHFGMRDCFRLGTEIRAVKQLEDKRWEVTSLRDGALSSQVFDFCVLATGMNSKPKMPSLEGKDSQQFQGLILHSADYRSNDERFKSKRVLIVGASASATEIASDLVGNADSASILVRKNYLVFPKMLKLKTEDGLVNVTSLECLMMNRKMYHAGLASQNADAEAKREMSKRRINMFKAMSPVQTSRELAPPSIFYDLEAEANPKFAVSEDYVRLVQNSQIHVHRGEIRSFRPDGITLTDESFVEADVVIFGTSHQINLSYLDQSVLTTLNYDETCSNNPLILYKYTWHPDLANLAFAGLFRAIAWTVVGLQSEWIMKVFSQQLQLPSKETATSVINAELAKRQANPDIQFPFSVSLLCDTFAKEVDKAPDLDKIRLQDPELHEFLWSGPILPEHFQLNDADESKRSAALDRIKRINWLLSRKLTPQEADKIRILEHRLV